MSMNKLCIQHRYDLYMSPRPCYPAVRSVRADLDEFIALLQEKSIQTVVVLLEESELEHYYPFGLFQHYRTKGFEMVHFPIVNYSVPSDREDFIKLLKSIDQHLCKGRILVHCSGGMGRTGTVVAAYLVHRGMAAAEAISAVRSINPDAIETWEQERFVEQLPA